jgi:putative hemolysin
VPNQLARIAICLVWLVVAAVVGGCASATAPSGAPAPSPAAQIANPASEFCVQNGGTVSIEQRSDGGQFGVCLFDDNRQCEEWAMFRGDCPIGGIKVTGYVTPAARYCAITGGTYTVTGNANTDDEQGTCTLKDGTVCDADAYYSGACTGATEPGTALPTSSPAAAQPEASGRYTGALPAADAIGQVLELSLEPDGTATLTTQYVGKGAPRVDAGTWLEEEASIVVVLGAQGPEQQRLSFHHDGSALDLIDAAGAGYGPSLELVRTPSGETSSAALEGVTIEFDAELALSARGERVPAVPVSEGPSLGGASPSGVRFLFDGATAADFFDPHLAQVLVYKADDWSELDSSTGESVAALRALIAESPVTGTEALPVLPPLAGSQLFHVQQEYVEFQGGSGIGFVTDYAFDVSPITATDPFYTFQGLTSDGEYYVAVFYPVTSNLLPASYDAALAGQTYDDWQANYEEYLASLTSQLDELVPAAFMPDLALVRQMVSSIGIAPGALE